MNWELVLALCAGGIIGFFGSIVANLTTPSFAAFFTRSKSGFVERNKRRAIQTYTEMKSFRDGKKDKYFYFVDLCTLILGLYIIMIGTFVLGMNAQEGDRKLYGSIFYVSLVMAGHYNFKKALWHWRIDNFSKYEEQVKRRWGEDLT